MSVRTRTATERHTGETLALPGTAAWRRTQPATVSTRTEILRDILDPGLEDMLQRFSDVETSPHSGYLPNLIYLAGRAGAGTSVVMSSPKTHNDTDSRRPAQTHVDLSDPATSTEGDPDLLIGSKVMVSPSCWLEKPTAPEASYGNWTSIALHIECHASMIKEYNAARNLNHLRPTLLVPRWYLATPLTGSCELDLDLPFGSAFFKSWWSDSDSPARRELSLAADTDTSTDTDTTPREEDSAGEANPVDVVSRVARILGVTQLDILRGTGIIERTFYDWKANQRIPRLASLGSLWALDQVTTDLANVLPDPKAWLRADPARRDLVKEGRFDELIQLALDTIRARTDSATVTSRASGGGLPGGFTADNAVLDVPGQRRTRRRAQVTPRRPRQHPRPQRDDEG